MRIAVCYSGQPRNIRETFDNHKKYLLPPGLSPVDIDKFAHFWFDESLAGKDYSFKRGEGIGRWDIEGLKDWILTEGDFKKVKFEKPKEEYLHRACRPARTTGFSAQRLIKPDVRLDTPMPRTKPAVRGMISMFYSMEQANLLAEQCEKEGSFKYDAVFRLRTDVSFASEKPFVPKSIWEEIENNPSSVFVTRGNWRTVTVDEALAGAFFGLYKLLDQSAEAERWEELDGSLVDSDTGAPVADSKRWRVASEDSLLESIDIRGGSRQLGRRNYAQAGDTVEIRGIKDQWAVGGSDPMKKYISVYSNLDYMIEEGALINPEYLLDFNAKINGVKVSRPTGFNANLFREK